MGDSELRRVSRRKRLKERDSAKIQKVTEKHSSNQKGDFARTKKYRGRKGGTDGP